MYCTKGDLKGVAYVLFECRTDMSSTYQRPWHCLTYMCGGSLVSYNEFRRHQRLDLVRILVDLL